MHPNPHISVSAVVLTDDDGRVALVRKHHTRFFIFPGGKPEVGEDGLSTAIREVREELGVELNAAELEHVGDYTTPAANEAGTELFSQVFHARLPVGTAVAARAEIAALIWVDPSDVELPEGTGLAPLSGMVLKEIARMSF